MEERTENSNHDDEQIDESEQSGDLFPPHPDHETESAALLSESETDGAYSEFLESTCGAVDDSQPVEQYDGALGVTAPFVDSHQASVGQLQWNDNLAAIYRSRIG